METNFIFNMLAPFKKKGVKNIDIIFKDGLIHIKAGKKIITETITPFYNLLLIKKIAAITSVNKYEVIKCIINLDTEVIDGTIFFKNDNDKTIF